MKHYDDEALFEYVDGISSMAVEIEWHVARCESCDAELAEMREMVTWLADPLVWEPVPKISPFVLSSLAYFDEQLRYEKAAAPALCDEVLERPLPWRLQQARKTAGTRTSGIVHELLRRMRTMLGRSPKTALEMTGLAVELADTLDPEAYPPAFITVVLGRALRSHGYALAFTGNYGDGLAFADRARTLLEEEMPHDAAYELARVAMVRAACLKYVGHAEEAAQLLREAAETFLRYGDREWSIKARISEGTAMHAMGAVERALEIWRSVEGAPELDELETTRVTHNIALCLIDLGKAEAAGASARQCVATFERLGHMTERTRSRTILGKALLSAGRPHEAISMLRQARREYLDLDMVVEAGVSALELAEGLLVTNQAAEVPAICREVIADFTKAGMGKQATMALAYLQEALELRKATPDLVRNTERSLRRHCAEQPRVFTPGPGTEFS
jgi:tetratricopeptide (TPR) repeat protein